MPDYQKLYTTLFNRVSDIIEELQKAQQEAEEMYISEDDKNNEPVAAGPFAPHSGITLSFLLPEDQ